MYNSRNFENYSKYIHFTWVFNKNPRLSYWFSIHSGSNYMVQVVVRLGKHLSKSFLESHGTHIHEDDRAITKVFPENRP